VLAHAHQQHRTDLMSRAVMHADAIAGLLGELVQEVEQVLDRVHVLASVKTTPAIAGTTTCAADACALTRALTSGPGRPRSS
jgi:hypothetical protein